MFANCLEIDSVNNHVLFPICSSSNASSSSKNTNASETKEFDDTKHYSSTYITLNQSRIISTNDEDIKFINGDENFRQSFEKNANTLKTDPLDQMVRDNQLSSSSSSSSVVASLSALSFSESNSISSFSSSISYDDIDTNDDETYKYEEYDVNSAKDLQKIDLSSPFPTPFENLSNESANYFEISNPNDQIFVFEKITEIAAPYKSKQFYGKDWVYTKLATHLMKKSDQGEDVPKCLVLLGNSGTGKTHLCCELKWPTRLQETIQHLNSQLISVYFFNWLNLKLNSLQHLNIFLTRSLQDFTALQFSAQPLEANDFFSSIDNHCTKDESYINKIGDSFINNVLLPLKDFNPWKHEKNEIKDRSNFVIIIDGIDETILNSDRLERNLRSNSCSNLTLSNSNMIMMFLNKILVHFPDWLTLVLTSKRCTEATYFKKHIKQYSIISMDRFVDNDTTGKNSSSNEIEMIQPSISSHSFTKLNTNTEPCHTTNLANLKDIQTYILKRLDNDVILKKRFNQIDAVELINLLLIKSNFCILFVEKILDLILANLISSTEIKNIPATLNGFYLYLIQLIINTETPQLINKKEILYSIFNLCIIDGLPLSKTMIFKKLNTRFQNLKIEAFETFFNEIQPMLFKNIEIDNHYLILNSSLVDWLTDVKFCTKEYLVKFSDLHSGLISYKNIAKESNDNIQDYPSNVNSHPVSTCHSITILDNNEDEGHNVQMKGDDIKEKLGSTGEKISLKNNHDFEQILFDLLTKNDIDSIKQILNKNISLTGQLNTMADSYNQNALLVSVKLNNVMMSDYLVALGKSTGQTEFLDHCDESGWTPLRYSAWMGNEDIVKILIENGATVDAFDGEGRTALRAACFSGHQNIVNLLLKHGADVNKCDTYNRTVLHVAVYMGHISLVTFLLKNDSNINQQDALGRGIISTCLYSKCSKPQIKIKIMKALINHGANLNEVDKSGQHPLILAVIENQYEMVSSMLELGADMDLIDYNCYTAIAYAVKANLSFMVDFLLKKNAATHILDKNGRSILSIASSFNSKEALSLLMERGLDEMHKDNSGWTSLHEAAFSGHYDIARMLLDYGSEIDCQDNDGKTSIFYACQCGHLDLVELLLTRNAGIDIKSHNGISPLRIACYSNKRDICEYLLNHSRNVDINYLDTDGKSILQSLVQQKNRNMDMIKLFLQHGADCRTLLNNETILGDEKFYKVLMKYNPNLDFTDENKQTILQVAIANDYINIAKLILEIKEIKINNQDKNGSTALSLACQKGNCELVNDLLLNDAQINASSISPIKIAQQTGNQNIVKLLQQWSFKSYNCDMNKQQNKNIKKTVVPRNSESIEAFSMRQNRFKPNLAPTSFSSYIKNVPAPLNQTSKKYPMSYHLPKQPTYEKFNKLDDLLEDSEQSEKIETKSSRFKLVKEKLLRKSSILNNHQPILKQSKSIESSIVNYKCNLDRLDSSANESSSFRIFKNNILNKGTLKNEPTRRDEIKRSTSFFQKRETFHSEDSVRTLKSAKSITNSSFYQMIRKKLKFLRMENSLEEAYDNDDDFVFKNNPIPRSITDSSSISLTNNSNLTSNSIQTNACSVNNIDKKNDDFAYILNRKSLNECLNPRRLFPDDFSKVQKPPDNLKSKMNNSSSSSYYKNSQSQYHQPAPAGINYQNKRSSYQPNKCFKKETSI